METKQKESPKPLCIYTPEFIKMMLANDTKWLYHGIVAIWKKQTEEEKTYECTVKTNGVGFNKPDAGVLSVFAEKILKEKVLNEKERVVARRIMLKYAGQLAKIANSKQ
jgi:hypothetical protein